MGDYKGRIILLLLLAAFPLVVSDPYYQHLMILVLMWTVIGSAWNLIAGYTGQVSFGHAAFFGIGAYTGALLETKLGVSAWWGVPLGCGAAVLLAFPFGWVCFRLRGAYFALATLALNEVMRHIATIWQSLTGGMVGILIMQTFISKVPYYFIALAVALVSVVLLEIVVRSRLGYYFVSVREDQDTAESIGINTTYYKMISLALSAALTGLMGGLYTCYMGFIDPHIVFSLHDISIMAILVGIVGGVGTVYGPAVGAFIMVAVSEVFRSGGFGAADYLAATSGSPAVTTLAKYFKEAHVFVFGLLVVFVILFLPNGVVGDWQKFKRGVLFWKRN
jgi:branched-chain amino acid transport system permease protein